MEKDSIKNIKLAFILNLLFSIIELIGGIFTNSISIISDSFHDFGDAVSIGIAFVLEKKSHKKPDNKYTYGYLRYSVLGAFITCIILLTGSIVVLYNAIPRVFNPEEVNYNGMLILAVIGLIINGIAAFKTSKTRNTNEKAVSLHMFEDVLGWAAVLIGSVIIRIFGWYIIDPILSIGITIYILIHVVRNIKEILALFLEKSPKDYNPDKIKEILLKNENIINIHHIHVWTLDGINNYLTFHVIVKESIDKKELINLKHYIKHKLEHIGISHTTIEFEYEDEECKDEKCNIKKGTIEHNHKH